MAKLPDIQDLGARPVPRSDRPIIGYRAGQEAQAVAEIGQQVTRAGARINERQDRLESAYAESALLRGQVEALDELQDNDYGSYEKRYSEKMTKVQQQAAGLIRDPSQRSLFEAQATTTVTRGLSHIRERAKSKESDFGRANQVEFVNQTMEAALKAPDEATQAKLLLSLNDSFHGMVDRGYMSAEAATKGRLATLRDYGVMKAQSLSAKDRVAALKGPTGQGFDRAIRILEKNEGGFTPSDGDSGAPAIYGINAKWHPEAYAEAKRLTDEQGEAAGKKYAQEFYKREFWDKKGIESLPPETQAIVFDGVVNHRTEFGDRLIKAAKEGISPADLIAMRRQEYERLGRSDRHAKSLPGWQGRLARVEAQAGGKAGDWTDFIPTDDKMRLLDEAKREMGVEVRQQAAEIESVARLGLTVPQERIENVAMQAQESGLPDVATDLRTFANVQDATGAFAKQGLADQEARLKTLKTEVEGGKLTEAPLYSAAEKVYETKVRMLKDEPWAYYQAQGVVKEHPALSFGDPQAVASQLAARRADAEAVRQLEGGRVALPLLTRPEIEGLKQAYETAPPQQAASMITSLGQSLNREERQSLARAVAPKSPMAAVALSVEPEKALRLISGSRAKGEVPAAKVRDAANEKLSGVVFDPDANEALQQAVFDYYKQLAIESGDATKEVSESLLGRAIGDVAGSIVNVGDSRVISYRDDGQWVDEDRLEDILTGITDDVLKQTNGLPYASDGSPVPAEEIKSRARFLTAGDGAYVAVYPGLGVVTNRDGKPYLFDARKIESLQKKMPKTTSDIAGAYSAAKVGR